MSSVLTEQLVLRTHTLGRAGESVPLDEFRRSSALCTCPSDFAKHCNHGDPNEHLFVFVCVVLLLRA